MKKLNLNQMEILEGGADSCEGSGWWTTTILSVAAATCIGTASPLLGMAASVGLVAANTGSCKV